MNLFRKNNYLILILPPVFLIILGGSNIDIQNHCKIIIDFSDEGRTFMGIGATAETSVRLLMDYPENVLREILRIMFEQNFGASLQHLKLEIGSDANSSSGTIPSHMRSKEDNCISRVFLLKFAKMAKEINHNLILSALRWGTPSWIKSYEDKYLFYKNYLLGAREVFNLEFDYLGPDQNEGEFDREWVKFFRKKLNEDGFERIKFIAADAVSHPWYIVTLMNVDEELKKIINIVGVHYTLETPTKALYCGKPIWHSEAWPLMWSKSWKERPLGGLDFAKTIMETFVKAKMCAYIMNPFVEAYYPIVPYNTKSCLIANTPWSGHYEVTDGVWIVAHFTQFIKPGWKIIDSASKFSNPFYCMTACDSGYQNYSIVIVNPTQEQLIYEFLVEDKGVSGKAVHVWKIGRAHV